jgi:hypothetical protein
MRWMVTIDAPFVFQNIEAETEAEAIKLATRQLPRNVRHREILAEAEPMTLFETSPSEPT